jgi:hypothetical protein
MDRYFARFPVTVYNDTAILDISRRVRIDNVNKEVPNLFYPVEIHSGTRPDVIADGYYKDPELDWMIYLANEIVDPYYGWYLNEDEFNEFILDKYGDYALPRKKIVFWRSNWSEDDAEITASYYENTLAVDHKQYYSPNYGTNGKIMSYTRKKEDWIVNTNKVYQYTVTYTSGTAFTEGEILDIKTGGEIVGGAEVVTCNSTALIVQHVTGNSVANSTWTKTLIGETSNTTADTAAVTVLAEFITNATADFWTPVTYFDWEQEKNESHKHIHVMNPVFVTEVSNEIRKKLRE